MNPTLPVRKEVCYEKIENPIISFDFEKSITNKCKLIDYIDELKFIATQDKWLTWGRTYVEFPIHVLNEFGIRSTHPLTIYFNYVYHKKFILVYVGSIFSGDAAWFDEYVELSSADFPKKSPFNWKQLQDILENHEKKNFLDYFDSNTEKWNIVRIHNFEAATIAKQHNNHLNP